MPEGQFDVLRPHELVIRIYYWYTSVLLIFSFVMTPFLFYVIFTQSKLLPSYKWHIANHIVWSFSTQFVINVFKPVIMFPVLAGYQAGYLRFHGSFRQSAAMLMALFMSIINCLVGVALSLVNRYLAVFPGPLQKLIYSKAFYTFVLAVWIFFYSLIFVVLTPMLLLSGQEQEELLDTLRQTTPALTTFLDEPTFFAIVHDMVPTGALCCFVMLNFMIVVGILIIVFFAYQTSYGYTSRSVTRLQKSLLLCSLTQIANFIVFLGIPFFWFTLCIAFRLPSNAHLSMALLMMLASTELMDIGTTMYYITPYRRYFLSWFRVIFRKSATVETEIPQTVLGRTNLPQTVLGRTTNRTSLR